MTQKTDLAAPFAAASNNDLNKLRASVLGANDGIVSTAGIVLGVAGANASKEAILIAGFAGLVAGAISMAAGEFVSVSSQRDSEKAFLKRRRAHIATNHDSVAEELVEIYLIKGFSKKTATQAAHELKERGFLNRELEKESGIDPDDITNPWSAAIASASAGVVATLPGLMGIPYPCKISAAWYSWMFIGRITPDRRRSAHNVFARRAGRAGGMLARSVPSLLKENAGFCERPHLVPGEED